MLLNWGSFNKFTYLRAIVRRIAKKYNFRPIKIKLPDGKELRGMVSPKAYSIADQIEDVIPMKKKEYSAFNLKPVRGKDNEKI